MRLHAPAPATASPAQTNAPRHLAAMLRNSILRLGWEFNGNWYAWSVATPADAANFAAFWKQIVNTLSTVPGQNSEIVQATDPVAMSASTGRFMRLQVTSP